MKTIEFGYVYIKYELKGLLNFKDGGIYFFE